MSVSHRGLTNYPESYKTHSVEITGPDKDHIQPKLISSGQKSQRRLILVVRFKIAFGKSKQILSQGRHVRFDNPE